MSEEDGCKKHTLNFVVKEDNSEGVAIEDDIAKDLHAIGITVKTITANADEYIQFERNGSYHMLFTKTWGAPYDPHTYLESWQVPSHVEYSAVGNLNAPLTREALFEKIDGAQEELDIAVREEKYEQILNDIHSQAIFLPLYGVRTPYVVNLRITDFNRGPQTYAYPLNSIRISEGSKNVSIAPGAGGALFKNTGPIHPHHYAPNQLFAQAWVYEGLVSYQAEGRPGPALAESWVVEDEGKKIIFTLRSGVKFHDGEFFNCAAVKLNFDHVLSDVVRERHSWFGTAQRLTNWFCDDEGRFVVETDEPYYPLIQELTYIRPLVIASPASFHMGLDSDPDQHNSCAPGGFGDSYEDLEKRVTCKDLKGAIGTGPLKLVRRTPKPDDDTIDETVLFETFEDYWGTKPGVDFVEVRYYETHDQVRDALISGDLDMALGVGPLTSKHIEELRTEHTDKVLVDTSEILQHAILVMNTNQMPTDNVDFRQAVMHGVNKDAFIKKEFGRLEKPVDQLMPRSAPYCDVDLNPKWSYDLRKARFINCPNAADNSLSGGAISGITVAVVFVIGLILSILYIIRQEKKGSPVFATGQTEEERVGFT